MTKTTEELIKNCKDSIYHFDRITDTNAKLLLENLEQLQQRNAELERERDELSARVNRLRDSIEYSLHEDVTVKFFTDTLYESPKTSLAEHDAEVARKALLALWSSPEWESGDVKDFANKYANKIRNGKDGE